MLLLLAGCEGGSTTTPPDPTTPDPVDRAAHCPARDPVLCAEDVGGVFPFTVDGDTLDGDDGYGGSACGGGGDAVLDRAYRWTAPWAGRYVITTEGSAFDTVLSLRQGSCAGRELACSDDAAEGGRTSELTVDLADCQTVTIVVDGGLGGEIEGPFVLSIRAQETACEDGLDDDLDGQIDCDDDDCFTAQCADPADEWRPEWTDYEWRVLEGSNAHRARGAECDGEAFGPAEPLEMDPLLRLAARLHSTDMAENDYFSHDSLDGRDMSDRISATGFAGAFPWGENIARGQRTPEEVVQGWMESPGHCRNIMNPSFHALGVGLAESSSGEPVWTQNFAGGR